MGFGAFIQNSKAMDLGVFFGLTVLGIFFSLQKSA